MVQVVFHIMEKKYSVRIIMSRITCFVLGGVFGVYVTQNYNIPDVKTPKSVQQINILNVYLIITLTP